jgi:CubicO group peptidase (beta-lactamase class C family)
MPHAAAASDAATFGPRHALDLARAFDPAAAAVTDGILPSAVIGVSDGHGTRALVAHPGQHDRGVTTESVYFLASVTKPIVATAVMQLVDEGRLDLHAPIGRYVPEWRGPVKEAVTAWHVLTHTAGIADIRQELLLRERPSYRGMLERICAADLQSAPGERYAYASDSFYLLAETISRLTGMPFGDALRRRLLEPLGMTSTTFDPRPMRSRIPPVRGVPLGNPLLRELILRFLAKATLPGGGLFGTAEDLLRLGRALLPRESGPGPRVLSQGAIDHMTREQTAGTLEIHADGSTRDPHYALGWRKPDSRGTTQGSIGSPSDAEDWNGTAPDESVVLADSTGDARGARDAEAARDAETSDSIVPASPGTFHHGGASGTRLWVDPERQLVFVFLTNQWGVTDAPMFATLREVYRAWDAARISAPTIEPFSA